jgi:hypothetical protein
MEGRMDTKNAEDMKKSQWISILDHLPKEGERVWGFDCFYRLQGGCRLKGGRLIWINGADDCYITHWRRVWTVPPTREEINVVMGVEEEAIVNDYRLVTFEKNCQEMIRTGKEQKT